MASPRFCAKIALAGAMAATVALSACGTGPQPAASTTALQSAGSLDDVLAAKGGKQAWSLVTVVAHDNDLASSDSHYTAAARSLAAIEGLNSVMVLDTPGQDGVSIMGFNGQSISNRDKEINSGSAEFVGTFLNWTGRNFPSDNRMLVMADHGGGIVRGIMVDDSSGHAGIRIPDLAGVMAGQHAQILAFDACLMQMLEVSYEVRQGADVVIAAESVTYAGSWPYQAVGQALAGGGSPEAAARKVVDAIGPEVYRSTVSAIRTAGAQESAAALDRLAQAAIAKIKSDPRFKEELVRAIGRGQSYKFSDNPHYSLYNGYRDIISTARQIAKTGDLEVANAAKALEAAAKKMVIRSWRDEGTYPDSNGIAFYAPIDGTVDLGYARNASLAKDTQWDEFLVALNSRGNFGNPLQKDKYPGAFPRLIYPGR